MTVETAVEAPESPVEPQTEAPVDETTGESKPHSEAAKYRIRAREAEAQRDVLAQRIEQLQRADIERVAAESLSAPIDFWLSNNSVADYVDPDTGLVDVERVREDAKLLVTERPGLRKLAPAVDYSQGSGNVTAGGKSAPTWDALLK